MTKKTAFIVETPQAHPGIKLYVSPAEPPSRSIRLHGVRADAVRFPTRLEADIARRRLSSLYGLVITEVQE